MDAWAFDAFGRPADVLQRRDMPLPEPGEGQVLVRVDAVAINFADDLMIRGRYQSRPELPAIAGAEYAGRIAAGPREGERVAGMVAGLCGAFAEYAVVDDIDARAVPAGMDDVQAAAFPVAYQTAWFALHTRGAVAAGDTVLVHAAAGGVGSAAVQLAVAAGAAVIGVVGSEAKARTARGLGCSEVFLRDDPGAVDAIKAITGPAGVQVVVDPVGGAAHELSERVIGFDGRIVIVGFASGEFPTVRAERALVKNYSVVGLHWGLYRRVRPDIVIEQYEALRAVVEAERLRPLVDRVIGFGDIPAAIEAVAAGSTVGRVVARLR